MITGCRPGAAWRQDRGDGWGSRRMRWNQRRWLARYLVAMPRNALRKPLICWWRLLTVWIWSSPRTRSPADWIRASWLMPRAAAAGGKQPGPSATRRASGPAGGGLDRLGEAGAQAERRGQRDVTLRGGPPDRVADAERLGELEPALLEPQ